MNYQRSRIEGESQAKSPPARRVARTLTSQRFWAAAVVSLVFTLVAVIIVAVVTRPLPRDQVPNSVADVRDELEAFHEGTEPCVRWPRPQPLTDEEIEAFSADLQGTLAVDLHTVLPFLSAVRLRNEAAAARSHRDPADVEFLNAVMAKLGAVDRLRFAMRELQSETVLPAVQGLRQKSPQQVLDRGRVELFNEYLGDRGERMDALVARWRGRLASREAQESLVHAIAERNTRRRIEEIQVGLAEYRDRFGDYPPDLARLAGHMRMTGQLRPQLMRGVERDGAVRDGWLRHFEYYRVGEIGYRLTSEGPSAGTNMDDLIVSELEGIAGGRLPGARQGEVP